LLGVALILAGCGGSGSSKWQQVQGEGFTYDAPAAWTVSGAVATDGGVGRVEVVVFRLLRPYDPSQRAAAARELDHVASRLAAQLKGSISSRRFVPVGGLDARSYSIRFGGKLEQITFALHEQREYQLLCRRAAGGDDAPCVELLRSFQLG